MSRKNNEGGDDDGAMAIAGALGIAIGAVLLWLLVGYAWQSMW